jgi:hypothetical protein
VPPALHHPGASVSVAHPNSSYFVISLFNFV